MVWLHHHGLSVYLSVCVIVWLLCAWHLVLALRIYYFHVTVNLIVWGVIWHQYCKIVLSPHQQLFSCSLLWSLTKDFHLSHETCKHLSSCAVFDWLEDTCPGYTMSLTHYMLWKAPGYSNEDIKNISAHLFELFSHIGWCCKVISYTLKFF